MKKQDYEQLTLFPADSHASRFPLPGSDEARKMTVTSGRKCSELLGSSDPLGCLAKMLLGSSAWRSQLVNLSWKAERLTVSRVRTTIAAYRHNERECCSTVSYKTSVTSVTPSKHLLFRLAASARTTDGNDCLLLPTPVAADAEQGAVIGKNDTFRETENGTLRKVNQNGTDGSIGLGRLVQMFPTPNARDWKDSTNIVPPSVGKTRGHSLGQAVADVKLFPTPRAKESGDYQYSNGNHEKRTLTLSGAAKFFATPQARDFRSGQASRWDDPNRTHNLNGQVVAMLPTPNAADCQGTHGGGQSSSLRTATHGEAAQTGGQLNPDWVEWLMGFPHGWTDMDTPQCLPAKADGWWDVEPDIPRVAVGVKERVSRLKCLGNAVVPYQAYPIFSAIAKIEAERKAP